MSKAHGKKAQQQWAKIIAKAWADEDFKARLKAEPDGVLKEEGIDVPQGVSINVMENTDSVVNLVIPLIHDGGKMESLADRNTPNTSQCFSLPFGVCNN